MASSRPHRAANASRTLVSLARSTRTPLAPPGGGPAARSTSAPPGSRARRPPRPPRRRWPPRRWARPGCRSDASSCCRLLGDQGPAGRRPGDHPVDQPLGPRARSMPAGGDPLTRVPRPPLAVAGRGGQRPHGVLGRGVGGHGPTPPWASRSLPDSASVTPRMPRNVAAHGLVGPAEAVGHGRRDLLVERDQRRDEAGHDAVDPLVGERGLDAPRPNSSAEASAAPRPGRGRPRGPS